LRRFRTTIRLIWSTLNAGKECLTGESHDSIPEPKQHQSQSILCLSLYPEKYLPINLTEFRKIHLPEKFPFSAPQGALQ
jgi:hypothetical protein